MSLGPSRAPPRTLTLIGKNWEKERDAAVLPGWLFPTLLVLARVLLDSTDGRV